MSNVVAPSAPVERPSILGRLSALFTRPAAPVAQQPAPPAVQVPAVLFSPRPAPRLTPSQIRVKRQAVALGLASPSVLAEVASLDRQERRAVTRG